MADFMETVFNRRSIRKFQDTKISEDVLAQVFEAVRWAPSWANTQCWELVVIADRDVRARLHGVVGEKNPGSPAVLNAPLLIAVCGKRETSGYYKGVAPTKHGDWLLHDVGLATANLCLAAAAHGLGTVVVGMFDHDQAREILSMPPEYEVVSLIPIGYPDQSPKPPRRKEVEEFVHYDRF